ncbi:hypothetical protein BU16DRAFT_568260 [Lophium mytilinum]|uniref:RRM domain-containing protein n=1 Tax=Lophium mytilinum TaxID=390894 RepID=A0A6A6Q7M0_9PEZI|nr:hypothetical protein BU16DRAFT_568260 [Lophium mytilinum]
MEEALILARVRRGLICKFQPPQDHPTAVPTEAFSTSVPDMLTKPMDTRSDIRAFHLERGKVLQVKRLPHDTTQSELESCFTQFGGRPIAFWTLRTPKSVSRWLAVRGRHLASLEQAGALRPKFSGQRSSSRISCPRIPLFWADFSI